MKCMYCKGEMKRGKAPFHIDRKGVHLTLDDVPAWTCQQCGESYFEETEVESIQAMIQAVEQEAQKLATTG
ncbi:MAG: type II toxin-antitoxin system MqsA family antitoxin [Deltaproteobacteria bacterium]|nr:type II toxin-antitoxin system MqsA family antitoxin [Deltaproteobacteria bacterium]